MSVLARAGLVAWLLAGTVYGDEATEFCGMRTESVTDDSRAEADERCNRVAGALVATPGPASLAQLAELDAWLGEHRRPPGVEQTSCDELIDMRRRAVMRAVRDRLDAEDNLMRALDAPRKKPPASTKRRRVHDLQTPF